jgi:hypothetical protein
MYSFTFDSHGDSDSHSDGNGDDPGKVDNDGDSHGDGDGDLQEQFLPLQIHRLCVLPLV